MGLIYVETLEVAGFYPAFYGMRNPFNSHSKMDSYSVEPDLFGETFVLGENDKQLAKKLIKGGSEHRKFLRQIKVFANVTMPRYVWQELDTYKFGTKNSESTIHTLFKDEITKDDFYFGDMYNGVYSRVVDTVIQELNYLRQMYENEKDYKYVVAMKRLLPESFIQMRTWDTNYEELMRMYHQRKHHRLKDEWGVMLEWMESLPYFKELCVDTK